MPSASLEKKPLAARLQGPAVVRHVAEVNAAAKRGVGMPVRGGVASRRSTVVNGQTSTMLSSIAVLPEHDVVEIRLQLAARLAEEAALTWANLPARLDVVWRAGGSVTIQGGKMTLETQARLLACITDALLRSRAIERDGRLSLELLDLDVPAET